MLKERAEEALRALVGLPLEDSGYAGLQWFSFGEVRMVGDYRRGKKAKREVGEYALHVQCEWRIVGPEGIVVGSMDRRFPEGNPYDKFAEASPGKNWLSQRLAVFFEQTADNPPVVESISADHTGAAWIRMSAGYSLEVFPCDTLKYEHWRLFRPATDSEHFVVTGLGIED